MSVTYTVKVVYQDGTGHTYTKLSRMETAVITAHQFDKGLDRPETIVVTTERE